MTTPVDSVPTLAADVARVIRMILEGEASSNSFRLKSYGYTGRTLTVRATESLLFEFSTLRSSFPDLYTSSTYSLLLLLGEHVRSEFTANLINDLDRLRHKDNIDKIVLWISGTVDDDVYEHLKRQGIDILAEVIPSDTDLQNSSLRHFVPLPARPLQDSLRTSHVAEHLIVRLRKLFHLVLSEIAAPVYDTHYAADMVASKAVMDFEERLLQEVIASFGSPREVAVDVGCGTGRHSFLLSEHFLEVYAFDLSPRMIQKAEEKKRQRGDKQIVFWCNDLEHERLTEEPRFSGRTDLIVASFGMGSFVEDTVGMLRRFSQWLRPGGKILLSFYNENSCVLRLTPSWRDTSLASNVNVPGKSLRVRLPNNQTFDIFCKPFNEGTKGDINKIFEIDSLVTYPTVLALLPNSLLKDSIASELFGRVDKALAYAFLPLVPQKLREDPRIVDAARSLERNLRHYGEIGSGHYVIVVAAKPGPAGAGYARALEVLGQQPHDAWQIIQHGAALSLEDVRKELGSEAPPDDAMVKTLVFKERGGRIICVSLAGRRHIDKGWLARFLGMGKNSLRLASERDISLLGFPLGGVAPIGFGKDKIIRRLVDRSVIESHHIWLYTGVGDNRRTLRIKKEVLVALLEGGEVVDLPRLDS